MTRFRNPLYWFFGALLILFLRDIYFVLNRVSPGGSESLERFFLYYPIACWVYYDSRKRKVYFPSDWILIFMVIFLPAYLFHTRRWKGLGLLLLWVLGLVAYAWFEHQILYALAGQ